LKKQRQVSREDAKSAKGTEKKDNKYRGKKIDIKSWPQSYTD